MSQSKPGQQGLMVPVYIGNTTSTGDVLGHLSCDLILALLDKHLLALLQRARTVVVQSQSGTEERRLLLERCLPDWRVKQIGVSSTIWAAPRDRLVQGPKSSVARQHIIRNIYNVDTGHPSELRLRSRDREEHNRLSRGL